MNNVEVGEDFVVINIENLVNYKIFQLSGTEIGWVKRKHQGEGMMFESPFVSGISIKNVFGDEDLEAIANEWQNSLDSSEVEGYLKLKKNKKASSLGGKKSEN
ncbi:hypothetical protein [Aquimarina sp. Aq107]|uniref:hypothetical protein n=1 Tax=Aquimarina sp. Aq107 TaxID=1191912 RepID=UPI0020B231BC|nr:hypothetical protein [Aquimarina sp. Aq107]